MSPSRDVERNAELPLHFGEQDDSLAGRMLGARPVDRRSAGRAHASRSPPAIKKRLDQFLHRASRPPGAPRRAGAAADGERRLDLRRVEVSERVLGRRRACRPRPRGESGSEPRSTDSIQSGSPAGRPTAISDDAAPPMSHTATRDGSSVSAVSTAPRYASDAFLASFVSTRALHAGCAQLESAATSSCALLAWRPGAVEEDVERGDSAAPRAVAAASRAPPSSPRRRNGRRRPRRSARSPRP